MAIDLRKRLALAKAIQQINFIRNTNRGWNVNNNTTMLFIIEEAKETILHFSQGTVKVLWMCSTIYLAFVSYQYKMIESNILNVK